MLVSSSLMNGNKDMQNREDGNSGEKVMLINNEKYSGTSSKTLLGERHVGNNTAKGCMQRKQQRLHEQWQHDSIVQVG